VRLSLREPYANPVEIGTSLQVPLEVAYRNLPERSRIYVHILTLSGDKWAMAGGGTLSVTTPSLSTTATFADGDKSEFGISPGNYPISILIKKDVLAQTLAGMAGNKEAGSKFADGISNETGGYRLTLAFLAAVGTQSDGFASTTLGIRVPDYQQYYDLLRRKEHDDGDHSSHSQSSQTGASQARAIDERGRYPRQRRIRRLPARKYDPDDGCAERAGNLRHL
jgi:hypothetical protein